MGLFTHICGTFKCIRCKSTVSDCIQTKLLAVSAQNSSQEYRTGEEVMIDGLENYEEMRSWDGTGPLRIAIGDWVCDACGLSYQWALATFSRTTGSAAGQPFSAIIKGVDTFIPSSIALSSVNFLEASLAELAHFPDNPPRVSAMFQHFPVEQKAAAIADGFRRWARDVAQVDDPF